MGELLLLSRLLSLKLASELLIERTIEEIGRSLLRDCYGDPDRALWMAEGMVNDEIKMDYLVRITARCFSGDGA